MKNKKFNKLVLQSVSLQDIVDNILEDCDNGELMSATGRCFGNVMSGDGKAYTFAIIATCDEEDFGSDLSLPLITSDFIRTGKGVIRGTKGRFPSSVELDESILEFVEDE